MNHAWIDNKMHLIPEKEARAIKDVRESSVRGINLTIEELIDNFLNFVFIIYHHFSFPV